MEHPWPTDRSSASHLPTVTEETIAENFASCTPVRLERFSYEVARMASQPAVDLDRLLARSEALPYRNPVETNRLRAVIERATNRKECERFIVTCANGTLPLVHEASVRAMQKFLKAKRTAGSDIEKKVYRGMTLCQFVTRLLSKRPLAFLGSEVRSLGCTLDPTAGEYLRRPPWCLLTPLSLQDSYLLKTGERGRGGFEIIGTHHDDEGLLEDRLR